MISEKCGKNGEVFLQDFLFHCLVTYTTRGSTPRPPSPPLSKMGWMMMVDDELTKINDREDASAGRGCSIGMLYLIYIISCILNNRQYLPFLGI